MFEKTLDANTCGGHTLQDFMTTVSIKLANKKEKAERYKMAETVNTAHNHPHLENC